MGRAEGDRTCRVAEMTGRTRQGLKLYLLLTEEDEEEGCGRKKMTDGDLHSCSFGMLVHFCELCEVSREQGVGDPGASGLGKLLSAISIGYWEQGVMMMTMMRL